MEENPSAQIWEVAAYDPADESELDTVFIDGVESSKYVAQMNKPEEYDWKTDAATEKVRYRPVNYWKNEAESIAKQMKGMDQKSDEYASLKARYDRNPYVMDEGYWTEGVNARGRMYDIEDELADMSEDDPRRAELQKEYATLEQSFAGNKFASQINDAYTQHREKWSALKAEVSGIDARVGQIDAELSRIDPSVPEYNATYSRLMSERQELLAKKEKNEYYVATQREQAVWNEADKAYRRIAEIDDEIAKLGKVKMDDPKYMALKKERDELQAVFDENKYAAQYTEAIKQYTPQGAAEVKAKMDAAQTRMAELRSERDQKLREIPYWHPDAEKKKKEITEHYQSLIADAHREYREFGEQYVNHEWVKANREYIKNYLPNLRAQIEAWREQDVDVRTARAAAVGAARKHGVGDGWDIIFGMLRGEDPAVAMEANAAVEMYDRALLYLNAAERMRNAHETYGQGIGHVGMEKLEQWGSQSDFETAMEIWAIYRRLQEQIGDLNEINEDVLETFLTKPEQALILSFMEYNQAQAEIQEDASWWYKAGVQSGEMIPFMLEFMVTGGLGSKVDDVVKTAVKTKLDDLFIKWFGKVTKKTVGSAFRTFGTNAISGALGTLARAAVQTAVRPTAYTHIAESLTTIKKDGTLADSAGEVMEAVFDEGIETLSELMGSKLFGLAPFGRLVKDLFKASPKVVANITGSKFYQFGKAALNSKLAQGVGAVYNWGQKGFKTVGFDGFVEEILEEVWGAAAREAVGLDEEALDELFKEDNFMPMVISMACLPGLQVAGGAVNYAQANVRKLYLQSSVEKDLSGIMKDEQIAHIFNRIDAAETPQEMSETLEAILIGVSNAGGSRSTAEKIVKLGVVQAKFKTLTYAQAFDEKQVASEKQQEIEKDYGEFWMKEDAVESAPAEATGEQEEGGQKTEPKPAKRQVQLAQLNDGSMVFILDAPNDHGEVPVLDVNTKRKGVANMADIAVDKKTGNPLSRTWSIDDFITMQVAKDRSAKEKARMAEEKKQNIAKVQQSLKADDKINLGTETAPNYVVVESFDENGVKVIDAEGNEISLTWEQVGNARGIRVKPLTDVEKVEQEVKEFARREAERIKRRHGTTEAAEFDGEMADAIEKEETYIPTNPDGSVDEVAFWNNDPEGWARWNDKQNEDGGADTLQQIEAAKAELMSMLGEARKGMKTSDPNMRKMSKAKALELEQKIARLEALELQYSPEAQAEKRLQEWEKATGVKFTRLYTLADVAAVDARAVEQARAGGLRAFAVDGKPYIYMQGLSQGEVKGTAEADEIFMHEAVSHIGLKGLLGTRAFNELCQMVWERMSPEARRVYSAYAGTKGDHLAAADEYIAHVAEKMGAGIADMTEKTIWEKIVEWVRNVLRSMGFNLTMSETELSDLLRMAYANLKQSQQNVQQEITQRKNEVSQFPAEVKAALDEMSSLSLEEQAQTTMNDLNAAQEAYDKLMKAAPKVKAGETTKDYIARKKAHNEQVAAAEKELAKALTIANEVARLVSQQMALETPEAKEMSVEELAAPRSLEPSIIGGEADPIGETDGNGSIRFSTLTYEQGGRDYLVNWLAKEKYMEQDEKDFIVATLDQQYAVAKELGKEFPVFGAWSSAEVNIDEDGNPVMSVVKENGDYAMNLDFSLICKKRRPLNALLDVMIADRMLDMRQLDEQEIATINKVIQRHGFEVACALCFVDSKRYRTVKVAKTFADMYNEIVESLIPAGSDIVAYESNYAGYEYINERNAQKTGRDLTTVPASELNWEKVDEILTGVKRPKSVEQKIAWALRKNASQRRLVNATDFVTNLGFESVKKNNPELLKIYNSKKGTGGPKASFGDVQYLNDILKSGKFTADKAAKVGGVRIQSFSDYMGHMFFDYMQMVAELSAKGLTAHAYTKEEAFARIFGMTGIKINMSLVPAVAKDGVAAGLDAEGNYVWAVPYTDEQGNEIQGQTFPPEVAFELQKDPRYSGNLGVIAVGVSDAHILKMLNDENIHFIIPYHKSSLNPIVAKMTGIDQYEDYTDVQNERLVDKPQYANLESKQKTNIIKKRKFDFYGSLARTNDPKATAKEYLEHCRKNDLVPKYEAFSKHENYYKLLADFNLYDFVTGEYAPQAPVKMNFPEELNDLVRASVAHNEQLESDLKDKVGKMAEDVKAELGGDLRYSTRKEMKESVMQGQIMFSIGANAQTAALNAKQSKVSGGILSDAQFVIPEGIDLDLEMEATDEDIRFSISKANRTTIEGWLDKRPDLTDAEKSAFMLYINNREPKQQLAMGRWFAKGMIRLPEDLRMVDDAFALANKMKVDPMKYDTPAEIAKEYHDRFGEERTTERTDYLSPDDARYEGILTNKVDMGNGVVVYDVQNDMTGRNAVRQIMNDHLGKDFNCWCLLYANANGEPTEGSENMWWHYNKTQKKVAFKDGVICAFCASTSTKSEWWSMHDESYGTEIPVEVPIEGDELGRSVMSVLRDGKFVPVKGKKLFRGNSKNGVYEEWANEDPHSMTLRTERKGGKDNGTREEWDGNGNLIYRGNYKKGTKTGQHTRYRADGFILSDTFFNKDGDIIGDAVSYYTNGQLMQSRHFNNKGRADGENVTYDEDGNMIWHGTYHDGFLVGEKIEINDGKTFRTFNELEEKDGYYHSVQRDGNADGPIAKYRKVDAQTYEDKESLYIYRTEPKLFGLIGPKVSGVIVQVGEDRIWLDSGKIWKIKDGKTTVLVFDKTMQVSVKDNGHAAVSYEFNTKSGKLLSVNSNPATEEQKAQVKADGIYDNAKSMLENGKEKAAKMYEQITASMQEAFGGDIRFSFIGEKGAAALDKFYEATTRIDNLAIAREMENKGDDAKAIKYATGWERGADGKWRYEIGDYTFRLTDDWRQAKTLGDAIEHDELFAAYPELKEIAVYLDDNANSNGGNFNPKENKITVRATNEYNIGHSLIHEIQHAIQHKEGFARGASVFEMAKRSGNDTFMLSQQMMNEMKEAKFIAESMDDNVSIEDLNEMRKNAEDDEERRIIIDIMSMMGDGATIQQVRTQYAHEYSKALRALQREVEAPDSPYNQYIKVMGEVESRNTSRRKFYSEVKRRSTLASETEDIAREDQIFLGEALDGILPTASESLRFSVNPEVRAEMDGILANAMVDGLFERDENGEVHMLAPNGKRSNLDMDKWALVRTANFKEWFGDWINDPENASKVVDENGEPKVVYHQTNASVYINRETGQNWDELGWKEKMEWDERDDWDEYWEEQEFNTFSRVNARTTNEFDGFFFAPEYDEYHEYGERTIPAFLNIKNPASREDYNIDSSKNDAGKDERIRLQNEGFDGVIRMEGDEVDEYIAFEPNQIKSIDNNGEFSESGDIRFSTSMELDERFGDAWRNQQNEDGRHSTQVANTKSTYEKIGNWMKEAGLEGKAVLDASSGLGLGTQALREMGFEVDDVEPFPSENREAPTFASYDDIDKEYDIVISNAVLNVIPDDWREDVLRKMASVVKDGGKIIINTRPASNISKQGVEGKTRITLDSPSEILVKRGDRIAAYQKGFTSEELADWIESVLGEGWRVEKATKKNSGISGEGTAVVVKESAGNIRFSTVPSSIDIEAVKGLQLFESMGYDLEGQMKLAEDSVAAALARIKYWTNSKKVGAEQGREGAQHAFDVAKRQMELLRDVQSQLIDVTYMEPAPREGDEPQNIREYIAQMLTGKTGSRLTPETLENELGWSAADRAGMKYIVSSKGMSVNELAELIMADAPEHVLRGMESDDVRNEILDFLQSVRTYAEIRDYMANARMAEAKAEADQHNADIDRFKEEFEAREGMTVEQYNEMVIQQMKEARDAWLASAENPAAFTPEEEKDVTDVPSDEELEGMTVDEIVNSGKQRIMEQAGKAKDSFMERVFKINARLDKVRAALAAQREYDQTTAALIADMANEMLENGALSKVTRAEIKRIVSAVKNAVGKQDITPYVDRIMDVMIGNQLRNAKNRLNEFLKIKGKKVNSSGVEVQGKLDIEGQGVLAAMKKGMAYDMAKLESEIAEAEDRLFDSSQVISRDAANELAGLYMAQEYMENIKASEAEEVSLRDELDKAQKERRAGRMSREAYREYEKSIVDAVRENRMQRVTAYENLLDNMAERVMSSIAKANALREADKARVERIRHFANSDMQGMPADELKQTPKAEWFWNSTPVRFFLSPLATFDQMLRHFAPKSRDGKGYLWNHFMGGWVKAAENEYTGVRDAHSVLDEKAREVFGKDVKRWSDIFSIVKRLPNMKFEVFDAGKMKEYEFTQGNLMYIYMVNKMSDGKMKLRRMGITEEQVEQIAREMDPRLVELADWLQDSFLPSLREKYNTVHERMFGAPMAAIENYFPLVINQNARAREEDVNNPQGAAKPSTITGAIVKRTKNSAALDLLNADALDVVLGHIEEMEHWAAFAEWNRDLNTLLSYKTFRNRLQNSSGIYGAGTEAWKNFRTTAEIAAGVYQPAGKKAHDKLTLNMAKGVTGAKIAFRVYTALKQFLSAPAFISDSRPDILMKNMANPMGAWNWAMENLPLFEKRWKSRQAGDSRLMATESDWKVWKTKAVEIAGRIGMTPNAFVDAVTVSIGARSIYETKYRQYLDYGYSEEQADAKAKQDATVLFNESQQSNEAAFLSQMQVDRTVASTLFTVFRNSSMGYQRMYVDALRNLGRMMKKGYKEESIEYMKKQMMRDGLTEEQAQRAAEKIYRRSFTKNATQAFTFGFLVQFAWNLGPVAVYLLLGDDDDEKKDMLMDAAVRAAVGGPVEGLTAGPLVSGLLGNAAMGEKLSEVGGIQLPAVSDLETLKTLWDTERYRGLNDLFNIVVQSGIGVNPQTFTDVITAVVDACNGDLETSKEVMFAVLRILQVPQSQIDKLYLEEMDITADEAYDMTVQEFAERYAKYKMVRNAPLTKGLYPEEDAKAREEKYIKRFLQDMRERRKTHGSEEAQLWLEYIDTEFKEMGETLRDLKKAVLKAEEGSAEQKAAEDALEAAYESPEYEKYEQAKAVKSLYKYRKEESEDPYADAELKAAWNELMDMFNAPELKRQQE